MLILASAQQPDYVALAMVLVLAVIVAFMALRKHHGAKQTPPVAQQPQQPETTPVSQPEPATAPGSAGQIRIYDIAPKTAAMLMCIVADKMGKPLNELRFISIKEVK